MYTVNIPFVNLVSNSPKPIIMIQPTYAKWSGMLLLLLTLSFTVSAQHNSTSTLRSVLTEIMADAESYEEYKVIRTTKLLNFKSAMIDSLNAYQKQIQNLEMSSVETTTELKLLKSELSIIKEKLEGSESKNASIGFLGMSINKGAYNAIVWSIIGILSVLIMVIYTRIKHVCSVVKRVKTAYSKIVDEYRNQRFQATEKQMMLRRELQTALNRLESMETSTEK